MIAYCPTTNQTDRQKYIAVQRLAKNQTGMVNTHVSELSSKIVNIC